MTTLPGPDPCRHAPATLRNRVPILDVLRRVLPASGEVLEIGSGSGEHAAFFATELPGLGWQPSDIEDANLASIAAWIGDGLCRTVRPPLRIDAARPPWPGVTPVGVDAVLCINVIHIAPWPVCQGLMTGAAAVLRRAGLLFLYGPFMRDGRHTAASNAAFDRTLRDHDPGFGVRDLGDVDAEARLAGLRLDAVVAMPANNLAVIFRAEGHGQG